MSRADYTVELRDVERPGSALRQGSRLSVLITAERLARTVERDGRVKS